MTKPLTEEQKKKNRENKKPEDPPPAIQQNGKIITGNPSLNVDPAKPGGEFSTQTTIMGEEITYVVITKEEEPKPIEEPITEEKPEPQEEPIPDIKVLCPECNGPQDVGESRDRNCKTDCPDYDDTAIEFRTDKGRMRLHCHKGKTLGNGCTCYICPKCGNEFNVPRES